MALETYKPKRFSPETHELIDTLNGIIDEYQQQGLTMTLRQLYYQMIGRDLFPADWIDAAYNAREGLPPGSATTAPACSFGPRCAPARSSRSRASFGCTGRSRPTGTRRASSTPPNVAPSCAGVAT